MRNMARIYHSVKHQAASEYAASGRPIFPCLPHSKVPATPNGFHDATTDLNQIDAWWTENPEFNPASCPHLCGEAVVDLDGPDAEAAWLDLVLDHSIPETYSVRTPRGGRHLYFAGSLPMTAWKNNPKRSLGPHIDTRGVGSYVLLPPSETEDGVYSVLEDRELADVPAWMQERLKPIATAVKASGVELDSASNIARARIRLRDLVARDDVAIEGKGGDNRTYQLATEILSLGLSPDKTLELIAEIWNPHCRPPWDYEALAEKVANAARYAQNEAGAFAVSSSAEAFGQQVARLEPLTRLEPVKDGKPSHAYGANPSEYFTRAEKTGDIHPTQHNIRVALADLGMTLRYDEFGDVVMLDDRATRHTYHLDDAKLTTLWLHIDQTYRFRPAKQFFCDVVATVARENSFHPVRDYLAEAQAMWDGTLRIDRWLTTYLGAEDTEFNRAVGRLLLIAAVKRVRHPGCKYDELVIFESEQGKLKSSALAILAVKPEWFTDNVPLNAPGKVVIEQTRGKWICEIADMHGHSRADQGHVKAFLSRRQDEARMAYGHIRTDAPRSFVCVGTMNDHRYLNDATGNRRYWPVKTGTIDLKALGHDRAQLWGEAAEYESWGASTRLDRRLWPAAAAEQEKRQVVNPFLVALERAFESHPQGRIRTADIYRLLGVKSDHQSAHRNHELAGQAMHALGWEKMKLKLSGASIQGFRKGYIDADGMHVPELILHWHGARGEYSIVAVPASVEVPA